MKIWNNTETHNTSDVYELHKNNIAVNVIQ